MLNTLLKFNFVLIVIFLSRFSCNAQTISDIDGNIYPTITIGTQIWMQENLKTSHFNNGDLIPTTTLTVPVDSSSIYQWAYNGDSNYLQTYGRLYSWFAVISNKNICPLGWHVPSNLEFLDLSNFLGGDSIAGAKLKENGTSNWLSTDTSVNNASLFTGLPGGFRGNPSGYTNIGTHALFWSSTPWASPAFQRAYYYGLFANNNNFTKSVALANCGLSVRCMKDFPLDIKEIPSINGMQIYPNPAKDKVNIVFKTAGQHQLFIYNMMGMLLLQQHLGDSNNLIDIHALESGLYILQVTEENQHAETILIKQ